jgi:hypothetical protein
LRHFITLSVVGLFSVTGFAQELIRADFAPVIEQSITAQEVTAEDVHNSVQTASNDDFEEAPIDTYKAKSQLAVAAPEDKNGRAIVPAVPEAVHKDDKDFALKLHFTGRASAQRYFPPKPKTAKVAKSKSSKSKKASAKLAKAAKLKKSSGKLAKAGKSKKSKTSSNRVAEEHSVSNQ